MSENEALQSDELIEKINKIKQNLNEITVKFTMETDKQKNERATKLQSLYRGKKARQETGELKDCKTKFEELENFNKDDDDEFETKLDDLYEKCKSRLELNPREMRKEYIKNKCNKATTFEGIKKINYYDKVNKKYILCENVAPEKYKELEKKRDEEEKRDIEERLQKQRKTKAAKAAALSARKAKATKCRAKIEELVGIYDSIKKETLDITKDGENIYNMFQLIIEIYDSRTFDNLETPGDKSVCSKKQLKKNKGKLSPIIKLLKTIELFQDEKYVTDSDNTYKVIIKDSLQTNDMDKKIVFNVELKDIATKKNETIRLLDLKFDTKTYVEVDEGTVNSTLELVERQNLREEEAAVKIQKIIRRRQQAQQNLIRKKRVKELKSELEKKQQPLLECETFVGKAACENEKGTDGLRKCEYKKPDGCKEIEGNDDYTAEERRKFLTYQYNEEQEIKDKKWKKFLDLKQGESYLPVQNGLSGPLKKIPYNIEYAVHVFEDGYYFDGQYKEKSVLDQEYKDGELSIDIQWGSKRDDPIEINVNNIYFSTLSGLGLYKNEFIENFQKKAKKAKDAFYKAKDNIPIAEKEILETATEVDNTELKKLQDELEETKKILTEKIAESKENEESALKKLKEQQQQELQKKLDEQSEEYNKALDTVKKQAKERSKKYIKHREKHKKKLEEAEAASEKSKQKIEKLNEQIKNLSKGDAEQKAQLEKKKKEIEKEAKAAAVAKAEAEVKVSEVELKKKELHEEQIKIQLLKSQHEKELEELRNLEKKQKERDEEERRKKMKEFMKHKGEALKASIESLKENEKFTNMSEIKIAALESYPKLHDKIKKFLVFKEDELIKAHHAKFYSDNIKRNNEKLVETLKLVPSEPFLGIEGLPLVSGFGSEEEKKEEEINLKVVKKKVRKFIQDRAEYIFVPSQHEQLSVKEYLKTL
jgi:hypothetical protein